MFLPGQREKYFEPPQNYRSSQYGNENDDDDDDDDDDNHDDNDDEEHGPPQNSQLHRSKKNAEDDNEYFDEEFEDDDKQQQKEEVPNISDMDQREKSRFLKELENEIDLEDEELEQENEVLKSSSSRWPVPIPYFLDSSLSSSKYKRIKFRKTLWKSRCATF